MEANIYGYMNSFKTSSYWFFSTLLVLIGLPAMGAGCVLGEDVDQTLPHSFQQSHKPRQPLSEALKRQKKAFMMQFSDKNEISLDMLLL